MLVRRLQEQELTLSQARKLFVASVLKVDDYTELKKEYQTNSKCLKRELRNVNVQVNEEEAVSIIDFLYLIAKNYQVTPHAPDAEALRRNRTSEKMQ